MIRIITYSPRPRRVRLSFLFHILPLNELGLHPAFAVGGEVVAPHALLGALVRLLNFPADAESRYDFLFRRDGDRALGVVVVLNLLPLVRVVVDILADKKREVTGPVAIALRRAELLFDLVFRAVSSVVHVSGPHEESSRCG